MAILKIIDTLEIGTSKNRRTDWEVSLTDDFAQIIASSYDDKINLEEIQFALKYPNGNWYKGEVPTYSRCRIKNDTFTSEWFLLNVCNENT